MSARDQLSIIPADAPPVLPPRSPLAAAMGGARASGDAAADCWRTPLDLFEPLMRELRLDLDTAALSATALLPRAHCIDLGMDGLLAPWKGRAWCNPPFSDLATWVRKARHEVLRRAAGDETGAELVALLCPARTETAWWRELVAPLGPSLGGAGGLTGKVGPYSWVGWRSRAKWGSVEVRLLSPRVCYVPPNGGAADSPAFGSCLVVLEVGGSP